MMSAEVLNSLYEELFMALQIDMLQDVIHVVEPQAYKISQKYIAPLLLQAYKNYLVYHLICTATTWRDYQSTMVSATPLLRLVMSLCKEWEKRKKMIITIK
jgi:hypothetical protein